MKCDAVIIGSGIGGLSIGALLAKRGLKVIVLERHSIIGGRCSSFNYQGHILDLGPHYFGVIDISGLNALLDEVGAKVDFVNTQRGLIYKDGKYIPLTFTRSNRFLSTQRERLDAFFIFSLLRSCSDEMINELDEVSVQDFLEERTNCEAIFEITRYIVFLSQMMDDLSEASAGELARYSKLVAASKRPLAYPKEGGSKAVADALAAAIKRYGGEVLRGEEVVDVLIRDNSVTGVITRSFLPEKEREINAPIVISNIPIQDTFEVIKEDYFPKEYVKRIRGLKGEITCGVGIVAGLSSPIFTHAGPVLINNGKDHIRYLVSPRNITPSVSPKGKSYLFYGHWVPPEFLNNEKKVEEENAILLDELFKMFPSAKDRIEWMTMGSMDRVNSLVKKPGLTGRFKPDVESPIEGLFFVGDSVGGGGSGIVSVISSVRICENRIISKMNKFKPQN